jgi:hypothetical protein
METAASTIRMSCEIEEAFCEIEEAFN